MGEYIFDQFTALHFAVGIVFYFWNIKLIPSLLIHTIFESLENTKTGVYFINTYLKFWPGGKPKPDSFKNSIGDTIGFLLGWLFASYLDDIGSKLGWYDKHIN